MSRLTFLRVAVLLLGATALITARQAPPPSVASTGLSAHIDHLASLDFATRMNAARTLRRATPAEAVPALTAAARAHPDQFVRYRALVVLTSFGARDAGALMKELLPDRNDRVREVAYRWFERTPDPSMLPALLAALQTEEAEFVRPALVSALAAFGADPQAQRALVAETTRGLDFFRSAVIDALGHHRATYAVDAIAGVAKLEGPLQDDAVLALGRIGGSRAQEVLEQMTSAPVDVMLAVRAAKCLAGSDCEEHVKALAQAAVAPGASAAVSRAAVSALSAVAARDSGALPVLVGLASQSPRLRIAVGLGIAEVAVRQPDHLIEWLGTAADETRAGAVELLKDGFDRLEEDFAEEQFFAAARASYWKADDNSPRRTLSATLIQKLEF